MTPRREAQAAGYDVVEGAAGGATCWAFLRPEPDNTPRGFAATKREAWAAATADFLAHRAAAETKGA